MEKLKKQITSKEKIRKASTEEKGSEDRNPPLSGSPQSGLPLCRAKNPPPSGPPQSGTVSTTEEITEYPQGYGLNSVLTPPRTPNRAAANHSSASESEGGPKRDKGGFTIPRVPKASHKSRKDLVVEEKDKKIADLEKQIQTQKEEHKRSRSVEAAKKKEDKDMTKAQAKRIEEAIKEYNESTKILQKENHYSSGDRYHHCHQGKVVDYLPTGHPKFTTLDLD